MSSVLLLDGDRLLSADAAGVVVLWNLASGTRIWEHAAGDRGLHRLALLADATGFVSAVGRAVAVHDLPSGRVVWRWTAPEAITALAAGEEGVVHLGNVESALGVEMGTGRVLYTHANSMELGFDCVVPLEGGRVLTGGADGSVRLWDASGCLQRWEAGDMVGPIVRIPDSSMVLFGCGRHLACMDLTEGRARALGHHADDMAALAFDPPGREAVTTSVDGRVHRWRLPPVSALREAPPLVPSDPLTGLGLHPDGGRLLSVDRRGRKTMWEARTCRPIVDLPGAARGGAGGTFADLEHSTLRSADIMLRHLQATIIMHRGSSRERAHRRAEQVCILPDGRSAVVRCRGNVDALDLWRMVEWPLRGRQNEGVLTAMKQHRLDVGRGDIGALAAGAAGAAIGDSSGRIEMVPAGRYSAPIWARPIHPGAVDAVVMHSQPQLGVSAGADGSLALWVPSTGAPLGSARLDPPAVALAFAEDGAAVFLGTADGGLFRWTLAEGAPTPIGVLPCAIGGLVRAGPGSLVVAGTDGDLWLVDVATGEVISAYFGGEGLVVAACSPDGRAIYAGGSDGVVSRLRRADLLHDAPFTDLRPIPRGTAPMPDVSALMKELADLPLKPYPVARLGAGLALVHEVLLRLAPERPDLAALAGAGAAKAALAPPKRHPAASGARE